MVRYLSIRVFEFTRILTTKGPYTNQYSCKHVGIWANLNQLEIWIRVTMILGFNIELRLNLVTSGLEITLMTGLELGPDSLID